MIGNNKFAAETPPEAPISLDTKNNAQLRLMELMGATDTEGRLKWIEENSDAFRELWKDEEFQELMRSGNFDEARARLEEFRSEQREAA